MGRLLRCVRAPLSTLPPLINNVSSLTSLTENYLQNAPGGEVPGALGLGEATASNIDYSLQRCVPTQI